MIKKVGLIYVMAIFLSCNIKDGDKKAQSSDIGLVTTFENLNIDNGIKDSINTFLIMDSCQNCLHEMFIDKIRPNYTILTLKSRPYSVEYLSDKKPLFKIQIEKVDFFIYSGLEDLFDTKLNKNNFANLDSTTNHYKIWSLHIKNDSIWWNKNEEIPFFPESPAHTLY